jgi:N-methylhydantoinase A
MRLAIDTGGTFTDLVIEHEDGRLEPLKSPTTPHDPLEGVLAVLRRGAASCGLELDELLGSASVIIHGTTWAINAIVTRSTARTAFLTTEGHPDVLVFREGGRLRPFDHTRTYPDPYVPRALTFEVRERVLADGRVAVPLDEAQASTALAAMADAGVKAIGVCLLWSIVNPVHEEALAALIEEHLPGVPYTLSHRLNPVIREYRRACSVCIDASLKPTMTTYFELLSSGLAGWGFRGRLLISSSTGGVVDADTAASAPIHVVNSGPAMGPIAGARWADLYGGATTAIVLDTGGTTFDVSLVRNGRIPATRETWLGEQRVSDLTGFASVDVRSVGAGGGTIAWVDDGGLLRFGPTSAGAEPGPACYGRGGMHPTLTDACVLSGYIDPDFFLGGAMRLEISAAREAVNQRIAEPLGLDIETAAAAIVTLATEHMTRAIEEVTLQQGVDPRSGVIIAGGGAAGLNAVAIGKQLGVAAVIVPPIGSALSAAGGLLADLTAEYSESLFTMTSDFDFPSVDRVLKGLRTRCNEFVRAAADQSSEVHLDIIAEARYPSQVWELDLIVPTEAVDSARDVEQLIQAFHRLHEETFATSDPGSPIEILAWRARVSCSLPKPTGVGMMSAGGRVATQRRALFADSGYVDADVHQHHELDPGTTIYGPAFVEMPLTTIVVYPYASATSTHDGTIVIDPLGNTE